MTDLDDLMESRYRELNIWRQATHESANGEVQLLAHVRCATCATSATGQLKPIGEVVVTGQSLMLRRWIGSEQYDGSGRIPPSAFKSMTGRRPGLWLGYPLTPGSRYPDLFAWRTHDPDDYPHVVCGVHGRKDWTETHSAQFRSVPNRPARVRSISV